MGEVLTEGELRDVEERRLRALVAGDLETARRLHADDYELITPGGRSLGRDAYLALIDSGDFMYETFEPDSVIRVRRYGGAGIARYKARIVVRDAEGGVDAGTFWHTDLWELRDGQWQAVWSQATRIREG